MKKLIICLILCFPVLVSAGLPGDYVSVYNYPITIGVLSFTGYKNMYNLDNPTIRCGDPLSTCTMDTKYTQYNRVLTELRKFKVFVPPGTLSISITVFTEYNARYAAVARMGQPPTGDYTGYGRNFTNQDWWKVNSLGFVDTQLKSGDCIAAIQEGILSIAAGNVAGGITTEGKWIYVNLIAYSGRLLSITVGNIVSSDPYMKWFRAFDWTTFEDSITVPASTPVPVATPAPVATPTPTPGCSWWYCTAMGGGTCVNGECVKGGQVVSFSPVPTPTAAPIPTPIPTSSASVIEIQVTPGQLYRFVVH